MKVWIETDGDMADDEVVIKCNGSTEFVERLRALIADEAGQKPALCFYKGNEEYHFPLEDILFFETSGENVYAHAAADSYKIKFRLYELEEFLPRYFVRISKSSIVNTRRILSINRNITSASLIQFRDSYKEVYVSRFYYKTLRAKLDERNTSEA